MLTSFLFKLKIIDRTLPMYDLLSSSKECKANSSTAFSMLKASLSTREGLPGEDNFNCSLNNLIICGSQYTGIQCD